VASWAREEVNFQYGQIVKVLSDKQYRMTKDNKFEAIGNVIISQGEDTIYGEKATLHADTGEVLVEGNVRYVGAAVTLYGTKLKYNVKNSALEIDNARIISENFVVLGKKISRVKKGEFNAIDAEYTTCKDCPESWSIFGQNINVTVGQYIRIKHAYLKAKGVVVMYIPYVILPIKNNRETGLLFPKFGLDIQVGGRFQLPWFWAISDHADMTFTPSYFGSRGWGGEVELRHTPKDGLWYQYDGLFLRDQVYAPGKTGFDKTGNSEFRQYSQWEHHYFNGNNFNHHLKYNWLRDMDMSRDYNNFVSDKTHGSDSGLEASFDYRMSWLNLSLEGGLRRNHLYDQTYEFDDRYVQIQPKVSLSTTPLMLFQSNDSYLSRLSFALSGDLTLFRQNVYQENIYIRNARRTNADAILRAEMLNFGPVRAYVQASLDTQHYYFPREKKQNWFQKTGLIYESGLSLEIEKVFGLAYEEKIATDQIIQDVEESNVVESDILGTLPVIGGDKKSGYVIKKKNSFKHSQIFNVKHYYLADQKLHGSERFGTQILEDVGLFDTEDIIRSRQTNSTITSSRTTLPVNNTVELQWNNSLIRKQVASSNIYDDNRGLLDNFNYQKIAFFDVSQGYDLSIKSDDFKENLTRLRVNAGFSANSVSYSSQVYYYYATEESVTTLSIDKSFKYANITASLRYDSFRVPIDKFFQTSTVINLSDQLRIRGGWEYDIERSSTNRSTYGFVYSPNNNCWRFLLDFEKTVYDKRVSFNFLINFNNESFQRSDVQ
jgi:LPS-assembly protein